MKRLIPFFLCFICLFAGCATVDTQKHKEINIVTTIFPIYDFVRAVGGENVDIKMLIDPGTEVHSFDPTPSDLAAVKNADCFFYIGGESDTWVKSFDTDIKRAQPLIDCANETKIHDEHIWTSPFTAQKMVEKIAEVLSELDPENAEIYDKNAKEYNAEIKAVAERIESAVLRAQNPFLLIADRNPYLHFAESFAIEYKGAFGGCATSDDISVKTMAELIKTVEEKNLTCAFYTEMSNKNIADALADETGVKLYQLNSAHNVTKDEFSSGISYVDLMSENAKQLEKGWGLCP